MLSNSASYFSLSLWLALITFLWLPVRTLTGGGATVTSESHDYQRFVEAHGVVADERPHLYSSPSIHDISFPDLEDHDLSSATNSKLSQKDVASTKNLQWKTQKGEWNLFDVKSNQTHRYPRQSLKHLLN